MPSTLLPHPFLSLPSTHHQPLPLSTPALSDGALGHHKPCHCCIVTQYLGHHIWAPILGFEVPTTTNRFNLPQPILTDAQGFEALLNLVNNTNNDSFELYYGLFLYNQNATEELERLEQVMVTFLFLMVINS